MNKPPPNINFSIRLADGRLISLLKPSVMGVINLSPDSFYQPYCSHDEILHAIERMIISGADIIDIGGEATNLTVDLKNSPNAQQQIDRVAPVVEMVAKRFQVLISIDTSEPQVMREAVSLGAHLINDQRGLQAPGALKAAVELKTPVCLMHFFNYSRQPGSCSLPELLATIKADLGTSAIRCQSAGITPERIIIDPGFGQGHYCKNTKENYYLLANLSEFTHLGFPILVGWSRKSMIGETLGKINPQERLYGSIAAAALAAMRGASIIRVHDVPETMDAIKVFRAFSNFC
ncbi:MAG: dihydropteroate synthase [Proteobacteria bacterium]|nr:dihydropteroate synthase [Pseudomonadota bacterium]